MHHKHRNNRRPWRRISALASLLMASTCLAGTQSWTNAGGDFLWSTAANWNPAAVPGASDEARFTGNPSAGLGTINLGAASWSLDALHFSNTSNGSYKLQNGTLALSQIKQDPGSLGNTIGSSASPNGTMINASTLTADISGGILHVPSLLTVQNLVVSPASSGGLLELRNAGNAISTVTISSGGALSAYDPGSLGAADISLAGGTLNLYSNIPNANFGNNLSVSGSNNYILADAATTMSNNTLNMGQLTFAPGSALSFTTLHGYTLAFTSTSLSGPENLIGTSGIGLSRLSLGAVSETGSGSALVINGTGAVILDQPSTYSGGTQIQGGMAVIGADGAVGSGAVDVYSDGAVNITTALSSLPVLHIGAGGVPHAALIGNVTGAQYSGQSQNVFLAPGSILGITAGPVPVRGVDVGSADYYLGITSATQTAVVGEDAGHTSIYRGAAFGLYTPNGPGFSGTISAAQPGQDLPIYLASGPHEFAGATFNTTDTTTGVNFFGPGGVLMDNTPSGTASVFTHFGNGASSQGINTVTLVATNSLAAGKTFDVADGIFSTVAQNAVANGAVVNINSGATVFLSGGTANSGPTTGTYNVNAGGALYLSGNNINPAFAATPGNGATFNYAPGSMIIMDGNLNTGSPTFLPATSDIVIEAPGTIAVSGSGIVLGDGRRLTTGADNIVTMTGGTGISAFPGAASVIVTASASDSMLQINDPLNLPNTDIQIGDTGNFTTAVYTIRTDQPQNGTVVLNNNTSQVKDVSLKAGNLVIGSTATDHFSTGNYTQDGGSATVHGQLLLTGAMAINAGTVELARSNGGAGDSTAGSLTISPGATLNIEDNTLDVASTTGAALRAMISSAYDHGKWDGTGLTSGLAGAATSDIAGIGYTLTGNSAKVRLTWFGDTDLNGVVNAADLSAMSSAGTTWATGDFNYDGKVNGDDYALFMLSASISDGQNISTVPEPSAALMVLAIVALAGRPRRRRNS